MAKKLNAFDSAEGALSVKLYDSHFGKDGSCYGKVNRRTVGLEQIIAYEAEKNEGVSSLMLQHSAALLQDGILSLLSMGYAVNVLGLGTMYLGTQGKITGDKASDVGALCAKFTPSVLTNGMASKVSVETVIKASSVPVLSKVYDTVHPDNLGKIAVGNVAHIDGEKLKLGGENFGLYFVPLDENGARVEDESKWIRVKDNRVNVNYPQSLEFQVPKSLEIGSKYSIAVRTQISKCNNVLKNAITGFSDVVEIVEDCE